MENLFTPSARNALVIAQEQAKRFKHPAVGTEHLLLALAIETNGVARSVLGQFNVTEVDVAEEIEQFTGYGNLRTVKDDYLPYSPKASEILVNAQEQAKQLNAIKIGTEHLLLALVQNDNILSSRILLALDTDIAEVRKVTLRKLGENPATQNRRSKQRATSAEGTPTLDSVARDLTAMAAEGKIDPVVGRTKEVRRVIQILSRRTKNNPVLIGEPGVGKTAIAEGLAQKIIDQDVPTDMQNKRLMMLEMGSLVAGTKYRGEFEDRLKKVIEEIRNDGQVIVFIDELHTLIGAGGAEGAIDASNILKPALARGELQTIGATTLTEYQKYIEADAALERRFAKVEVDEPTEAEAVQILRGIRPKYEEHHQVKISDDAIQQAVTLSSRYIADRFLPDKAIDLIDEAAAKIRIDASEKQVKKVTDEDRLEKLRTAKEEAIDNQDFEKAADIRKKEMKLRRKIERAENNPETNEAKKDYKLIENGEDIAQIVSDWTGVPLTQMKQSESDRLINLEKTLHERVIGQEEAVSSVARAIRRARSGLKSPKRPIGSFMFLGPTGVGKTELAKSLADIMFGSEDNMIRIDMSEYMERYSTSRLVGSAPGYVGYDEGGQLTEQVRRKPYSVVLFDEVEKAHPDVFNLLLQVFDDGFLTDSKGRRVDFRNTIIIMTSNLGATALRDEKSVGFGAQNAAEDYHAMADKVREVLKQSFRPEFLNRIDETIIFHSLTKPELHQIVKLMAKDVIQRMSEQGINAKFTPSAIDVVAEAGFDPGYGARPLRRALQTKVEDPLSELMLSGEAKVGDDITIGARNGKINLKVKNKTLIKNK
ncbi:ATP-dependent Clp protease ATP-binding subunit [Pediococcus pentosaceus]|uniref:ATP-dependent Clp protease ATP-binding subunit n=1 Tax=Pediococcus pentosaceus TaxID=1255 RepID=UPI001323E03B|nr:ATP-dependent Clp protease ATP-binding subunit [Pediococcus pentosaceus]KAF0522334.1 AAA domain-containing protein [Pediococcus pentosaceus]